MNVKKYPQMKYKQETIHTEFSREMTDLAFFKRNNLLFGYKGRKKRMD